MNQEQLKIIISANTKDATDKIKKTKEELKQLKQQSEKTDKYVSDTVASIKKGATVALASVTALVAGMVAMGKTALENQKNFAKLNTAFQNLGASATQAKNTYTALYRFLGDSQTATEAANLLAQITTNEQDLTQWTKILQGVYATFPDSLPVEALAEATNETIKTGVVTGNLADAVNWLGVSEDAVNETLSQLNSTTEREAFLRDLLNKLYSNSSELYEKNNKEVLDYNASQAKLDTTMASLSKTLIPMMTALNNVANVLLTALTPAFRIVSAAIIVFCEWIAQAVTWIASLFSINVSFDNVANSIDGVATSLGNANNGIDSMGNKLADSVSTAKELKKQTMGFDELNVVSKNSSSGSGNSGSNISIPKIDASSLSVSGGFDNFKQTIADVKEQMEAILVLVGLVGAGILAWKILDAYTAGVSFGSVLKGIGAKIMIVAGALLLVKGYTDAWANGVSWKNLLLTLSGIALIVGGLAITFGTLGAAIGIVAGGVALLVLGVKDFISNGASMKNTILIIGGAIAIAVGLATGGISVLVSAIVAVIAAIGAFTAAILLEEPAIMSVEEAQEALTVAKEKAAQAENSYISAVDAAESAMNKLKNAEKAAGVTGKELYKQVQNGTLDYADMTDAQKEVYKAYLENEQKQKELEESTEELNKAKKAETIASYENQLALAKESGNYDKYKKSVIDAFEKGELSAEECRDLIAKSMSEMSDDAQQTFMKDLPKDIKNGLDPHQYESTGTKIKKWFSNTWATCKKTFSDAGKWFAEIGATIGEAVGTAFKKVVNWILEKIEQTINLPFKLINSAIDILNKIPNVNITKLELISVPRLAKGGITTGSTLANIGEAGREAVLPLENNTGWMDILADRIASRNNTPSKIVLMLDSKELGWANINSINNITKQTGALQLALI